MSAVARDAAAPRRHRGRRAGPTRAARSGPFARSARTTARASARSTSDSTGEGGDARVVRVRGAKDHPYTRGVICAKVSRYAERIHHPDRLTRAHVRRSRRAEAPRDAGSPTSSRSRSTTRSISSPERLERVRRRARIRSHLAVPLRRHDGPRAARRARSLSPHVRAPPCSTRPTARRCPTPAGSRARGYKHGTDARTMVDSDVDRRVGRQPRQHAGQRHALDRRGAARERRDARRGRSVPHPHRRRSADLHLMPRPGTDGALACATMHVLFAEGLADRDHLAATHRRCGPARGAPARPATPTGPSSITGVPADDIVRFATALRRHEAELPACRLRLRALEERRGQHARGVLPAVGHGRVGGARRRRAVRPLAASTRSTGRLIQGLDVEPGNAADASTSRGSGACCAGTSSELGDGPPVAALLVQNTNPALVAPETRRVLEGPGAR